ncbi:type III secretion system effector avirulence protein AvrBs2, partial [Xanthomonas campestris]
AASRPAAPAHVAAVREGRLLDRPADHPHDAAARQAVDARADALGLLPDQYRGAPATHYLNEQAKQIEPGE